MKALRPIPPPATAVGVLAAMRYGSAPRDGVRGQLRPLRYPPRIKTRHQDSNPRLTHHLLALGTACNTRDIDGRTPLHHASVHAATKDIIWLLLAGAGVNATTPRHAGSVTPLHLAASAGHTDIVRILHQAGAVVDVRDANDNTPLLAATQRRKAATVHLLLTLGADPRASNFKEETALHHAI